MRFIPEHDSPDPIEAERAHCERALRECYDLVWETYGSKDTHIIDLLIRQREAAKAEVRAELAEMRDRYEGLALSASRFIATASAGEGQCWEFDEAEYDRFGAAVRIAYEALGLPKSGG